MSNSTRSSGRSGSTTTPLAPFQFRLYDVAEYSAEEYGQLKNYVVCFGRNPKGERVSVFVQNVPHEIYLAVPETFTDADRQDLERLLNGGLLTKNKYLSNCRFTDCPKCYPPKPVEDEAPAPLLAKDVPDEIGDDNTGGSGADVEAVIEEVVVEDVDDEEEVPKVASNAKPAKKGRKASPPSSILSEPCKEARKKDSRPVVSSSFVRRRGFIGYEKDDRKFARFVLSGAFYARDAEQILNKKAEEFSKSLGNKKGVYEVCPNAVDSFMRLADARGFFWYECGGKYTTRSKQKRLTRAEHEIVIDFKDLKELSTQPSPTNTDFKAPVVSLIFDIETISSRANGMSNPNEHPIGMIGVQVVNDLDPSQNQRCLFTWGGMTPRTIQEPAEDGIKTRVFRDSSEALMLMRFRSFVIKTDPDFLVGYNSNNFDLPYILTRAQKLKEPSILDLSLFLDRPCRHMLVERKSNQLGTRKVSMIDLPGRTCFDLYPFSLSRLKLRRYRMQDVVEHLDPSLKKGELEYKEIFGLFHGNLEQRRRLIEYCMLDCYLTSRILKDLSGVPTLVAQSQVFRARPIDVLEKGQLARNGRLIRGWTKNEFLIPGRTTEHSKYADCSTYAKLWGPGRSVHFEGGRVFDPKRNKHDLVACLDFNSLYPSIIRAHNLCHTTFVLNDSHRTQSGLDVKELRETVDISSDAAKQDPNHEKHSFTFVRESVREGVLPKMLTSLLEARKRTKKLRDECTDPRVKQALDAEQDSYKLCANSVYGLLGFRGELENFAAAASVTAYGRHYIDEARKAVESRFGDKLEFVYGDTDSIMFSLSKSCNGDLDAARKVAHDMANYLNAESKVYPSPMKIEFEKIFKCMLLEDKKRYAGYSFDATVGSSKGGKFFARGLETVRRDFPPYVSECLKELLGKMLIEVKSDEELLQFVRRTGGSLLLGDVPPEKLKMSAAISKALDQYATPARQPHVAAARALQAMGIDVRSGDRIEYVYVAREAGVIKSEKALPWSIFVSKENQETLDYDEYFEKLSGPFKRALFYLPEETTGPYFDKRRYERLAPDGEIIPAAVNFDEPFIVKKKRVVKPKATSVTNGNGASTAAENGTLLSSLSGGLPTSTMTMLPKPHQHHTSSRLGFATMPCDRLFPQVLKHSYPLMLPPSSSASSMQMRPMHGWAGSLLRRLTAATLGSLIIVSQKSRGLARLRGFRS